MEREGERQSGCGPRSDYTRAEDFGSSRCLCLRLRHNPAKARATRGPGLVGMRATGPRAGRHEGHMGPRAGGPYQRLRTTRPGRRWLVPRRARPNLGRRWLVPRRARSNLGRRWLVPLAVVESAWPTRQRGRVRHSCALPPLASRCRAAPGSGPGPGPGSR